MENQKTQLLREAFLPNQDFSAPFLDTTTKMYVLSIGWMCGLHGNFLHARRPDFFVYFALNNSGNELYSVLNNLMAVVAEKNTWINMARTSEKNEERV